MNTTGRITWKPTLDKSVTKSGGSQMTKPWIRYNLEEEFGLIKSRDILKNYQSVLIGVSKENDIIINTLDKNAKITGNSIKLIE
jgi:hypothetical protein